MPSSGQAELATPCNAFFNMNSLAQPSSLEPQLCAPAPPRLALRIGQRQSSPPSSARLRRHDSRKRRHSPCGSTPCQGSLGALPKPSARRARRGPIALVPKAQARKVPIAGLGAAAFAVASHVVGGTRIRVYIRVSVRPVLQLRAYTARRLLALRPIGRALRRRDCRDPGVCAQRQPRRRLGACAGRRLCRR